MAPSNKHFRLSFDHTTDRACSIHVKPPGSDQETGVVEVSLWPDRIIVQVRSLYGRVVGRTEADYKLLVTPDENYPHKESLYNWRNW